MLFKRINRSDAERVFIAMQANVAGIAAAAGTAKEGVGRLPPVDRACPEIRALLVA